MINSKENKWYRSQKVQVQKKMTIKNLYYHCKIWQRISFKSNSINLSLTHTSKLSIHFNWWIMIDCGFSTEQIHLMQSIQSHDNDCMKTKRTERESKKSKSTINERSNECSDLYTWPFAYIGLCVHMHVRMNHTDLNLSLITYEDIFLPSN